KGTKITLPAAPVRGGYIFGGWGYGSRTYQPGDQYTVTGSINFIARWSEKPAVKAIIPEELRDAPREMWLLAYYGSSDNYSAVSAGDGESITISPWYFYDGKTLSRLELYTYVNGKPMAVAEYNGEVSDDSGEVALVRTGPELWLLNDFTLSGLSNPADYSGYRGSVKKDGVSLYMPCLVTSDFAESGLELAISPNRDSGNYPVYDWNNTQSYTYSFNKATGVLTADVPKIAPPSANVSGRVTVSDTGRRVAGVTVTAEQYYKDMYRTASAATDENGGFTLALYPAVNAFINVYAGGEQLYISSSGAIESPQNGDTLDIKVQSVNLTEKYNIIAAEGNEKELRDYLKNSPRVNVTVSGGGKTESFSNWKPLYSGLSWNSVSTLRETAEADSVIVSLSSDAFEPVAPKTADISQSRGSVEFTLTPKPGAVVDLKSAFTVPVILAWYDADGTFISKSDSFSLSSYEHTFSFVSPNGAGSFKIALVPASCESYLNADVGFDALPETLMTWDAVLEAGKISRLESFAATERASENAVYVTKPGSTLTASRESFSNAGELIAFSGEIGLDSGISDGKLQKLKIRTGDYSDRAHVWNSAPVQAVIINGVDYMDKLSYIYHTDAYSISGLDIELPCEYTIYCTPGSLDLDMDVTLTADVSYDGGSVRLDNQTVGSAIVKRPGAYLDTLSTYVNRDTVTVSGRARPEEEVTVFDNGTGAGKAAADRWGDWTAEVKLSGVSETEPSIHILTSVSAS
ncbi:MAG: hypothetical protein IIY34_03715, partial [Clostridia bacterium]|nr:hypothetical protein [Clostridia bacterium]